MTNPLCECSHAGYCPRHQMTKSHLQWQFCRGEANSIDCGRKFWRAWELGYQGAVAPEDPQPDSEWTCREQVRHEKPRNSPLVRPVKQSATAFSPHRCEVGKRLTVVIREYGEKGIADLLGSLPHAIRVLFSSLLKKATVPKSGCGCKKRASRMDSLGCEGCEREIESLIDGLMDGASERWLFLPATLLWKDAMREKARELIELSIAIEKERIAS